MISRVDDNVSIHERLSTLEGAVKRLERDIVENTGQQTSIEEKIDEISNTLTKYKGFIGGIIFVFSCIATFFKLIPATFPGLFK